MKITGANRNNRTAEFSGTQFFTNDTPSSKEILSTTTRRHRSILTTLISIIVYLKLDDGRYVLSGTLFAIKLRNTILPSPINQDTDYLIALASSEKSPELIRELPFNNIKKDEPLKIYDDSKKQSVIKALLLSLFKHFNNEDIAFTMEIPTREREEDWFKELINSYTITFEDEGFKVTFKKLPKQKELSSNRYRV